MSEEIAMLFREDVQEKKRASYGVQYRNQRGRGAVHTPYDSLHGVEKRKYKQGSKKIVTYNMNDIIPYEEFRHLVKEDQRRFMSHWYNVLEMSWTKIQAAMGIKSNSNFATMRDALEIKVTNTKQLGKMERMKKAREIGTDLGPEEYQRRRQEGMKAAKEKKLKKSIDEAHQQAILDNVEWVRAEGMRREQEAIEAAENERKAAEKAEKKAVREQEKQAAQSIMEKQRETAEAAVKAMEARREEEAARRMIEQAERAEKARMLEQEVQAEVAQLRPSALAILSEAVGQTRTYISNHIDTYVPVSNKTPFRFNVDLEGTGDENYQRLVKLLQFLDRDNGKYTVKIEVEGI
jgi:hypothetical protein